jgi:FkbM family methyltransferase
VKRDDLIIDVGMHRGEDTRFYLAKGFRVAAVEANPALATAARETFAAEITAGRLRIFEAAITETPGTVSLAVADDATEWSSLSAGFVARNERNSGTTYRHVDVPAMRFEQVLEEVGIPHYLKVDIEGYDMLCVRALRAFDERPDFVSIESAVSSLDAPLDAAFDELAELWTLGYRRFGYVNQNAHPWRRAPNPAREGAYVDERLTTVQSGLFGEELPVPWSAIGPAMLRAQALRVHHNLSGNGGKWTHHRATRPYWMAARLLWRMRHSSAAGGWRGWWDLHARLG